MKSVGGGIGVLCCPKLLLVFILFTFYSVLVNCLRTSSVFCLISWWDYIR